MGRKVYLAHLWSSERKTPTKVVSVSFDINDVRKQVLSHARSEAKAKGYIVEDNPPTEGIGVRIIDNFGMVDKQYLIKDAEFHGERALVDVSSLHYIYIKTSDLSDIFSSTIDSAFSSKDSMIRFMDKRLIEMGVQGYTYEEVKGNYIVKNKWGNVVRVFALTS